MTENEKKERLKEQKRQAQKRYYEKNKDKWKDYGNNYYMNMKEENKLLKDSLIDIRDYITSIPNYKFLTYFLEILKKIDSVVNDES